uniref:FK506-binding protein n=1 Tax=Ganoderma boninense TaxID=34458 RepID=A0A5K1JZA4_9APHY|nr:Zn(2)-C6 fungal-type domain-containing protein [Ganoderma boninense]
MAVAVALWSLTVTPGEPTVITPPADLRITNVALGDQIADESSRTTVKVTYRTPGAAAGDEEDDEDDDESEKPEELSTAVLCSLTFGKVEQTTVDVVLSEDDEYLFEVVGKNTVHLTGNYIDQRPPDQDPYSDEESEDDFDLRDVSSDVEINPDELDIPSDGEGRFEEIVEDNEPPKKDSKKRPRESDAMDTQEPGAEPDEKLSKSQKKKLKKLKGANGEAVDAPTPDKSDKTKGDKKEKKEKVKGSEPKTLQGGVVVVDHKVGTGPPAKSGNTVSMRYVGKLQNGKIFDQNVKGTPFKFRLGKGKVIKGWDVGVAGMQVGGERLLTIPAPMGYGSQALSGIPANSTLTFEVKLLEIK